jgi:hypothetical protein
MGSAAKHLSNPPKAFTASAVTVRPACQLSRADVSGLTALSLLLHAESVIMPQMRVAVEHPMHNFFHC